MHGLYKGKKFVYIYSKLNYNLIRDNVEWTVEQEKQAEEFVQKNSETRMSEEQINNFEENADQFWDSFYDTHQNNFFKDRHWLFTEFPELKTDANDKIDKTIFEIGCGVGNTIFPILRYNEDQNLQVYGCDFSPKAIEIVKNYDEFDTKRCKVFVLDATKDEWNETVPFEENSIDIIIMIFVLSAIHPEKYKRNN